MSDLRFILIAQMPYPCIIAGGALDAVSVDEGKQVKRQRGGRKSRLRRASFAACAPPDKCRKT